MNYEVLNLSEFEVVKLLMRYRYDFDYGYDLSQNNSYDLAGDVKSLNVDMIALFAYLDELIKNCNFDKEQLVIVDMLQRGYTYQEIANELGKGSHSTIKNRFDKICRDIIKENERQWRIYTYLGVLDLKSKGCSKCKKTLPATDEFFRVRSDSYGDGFYNFCRKCEN